VKKLYFAHPINTYAENTRGTPNENLERDLLALIAKKFPHHEIVNPSDSVHADKVAELRKDDPKVNVMPYFTDLVASCDDLVGYPFGDDMWGAGMWAEGDVILGKGGFAWVIHPTDRRITFVPDIPAEMRLSVDETRARIRNPDGTSKLYV